MDFRDQLKESMKKLVKQELWAISAKSVDKHWDEMRKIITEAVQESISKIPSNDLFIDQIKSDVGKGATYVAVSEFQHKVASDCLEKAMPFITQFAEVFIDTLKEATRESIFELIKEQTDRKRAG